MSHRQMLFNPRESMAAAQTPKAAKTVLCCAQTRLADVQFIGWPALEESLQRELDDITRMARERGLIESEAA